MIYCWLMVKEFVFVYENGAWGSSTRVQYLVVCILMAHHIDTIDMSIYIIEKQMYCSCIRAVINVALGQVRISLWTTLAQIFLTFYNFKDEELARQLVELGYRGSGEVLKREEFEARKAAAEASRLSKRSQQK